MDWRLWILWLGLHFGSGKVLNYPYMREKISLGTWAATGGKDFQTNRSLSDILHRLDDVAATTRLLLKNSARNTMTARLHEEQLLIRTRRNPMHRERLIRNDAGVNLVYKLNLEGQVSGTVMDLLEDETSLLIVSSVDTHVLLYEFNFASSNFSQVDSFPGVGKCEFVRPSLQILLVCGPSSALQAAHVPTRVQINEVNRKEDGTISVSTLQPVFMSNVVTSAGWQQDGEEYMLLADYNSETQTSLQFRNSKRFFASKESSKMNFDGSVQIYKRIGHVFDLVEGLPAERPEKVVHFVINNFHFIIVAEGNPDSHSAVYRYSLDLARYVLLQRLPVGGAAVGVAVFTLGAALEKDTFVALATRCDGVCKMRSGALVYKYFDGKFLPFQALYSPAPVTIQALQNGSEVLLIVEGQTGLHLYQYSGWRFIKVKLGRPEHFTAFTAAVTTVMRNGSHMIALSGRLENSLDPFTRLYSVHYNWGSPLSDYYASISKWIRKALQGDGVAGAVLRLAREAPRTDGPLHIRGPAVFKGNVIVAGGVAAALKAVDTTTEKEIPATVHDSFSSLDKLKEKLVNLLRQSEQIVSLDNPDNWPRSLRVSTASVDGHSTVEAATVHGTVNGHVAPVANTLVPLASGEKLSLKNATFDWVYVTESMKVKNLIGIPVSRYVTLTGTHVMEGSVTLEDGASVSSVTLEGTLNGLRYDTDYLLSNVQQNVTGALRCTSTTIEHLSSETINSVSMKRLFDEAVPMNANAHVKGSMIITGNLTYDSNLATKELLGTDMRAFASSVLLKDTAQPQRVTGNHTYNILQVASMKVNGLLSNTSTEDLFLNLLDRSYVVPRAQFSSLTVNKLNVTSLMNEIEVRYGSLDVMLTNEYQTVIGTKEFYKFHLSDVYEESDPLTTQTSSTTSTTSTTSTNQPTDPVVGQAISVLQTSMSKFQPLQTSLLLFPIELANNSDRAGIQIETKAQCNDFMNYFASLKTFSLVNVNLERLASATETCMNDMSTFRTNNKLMKRYYHDYILRVYGNQQILLSQVNSKIEEFKNQIKLIKQPPTTTEIPTTEAVFMTDSERILKLKLLERELRLKLLNQKADLDRLKLAKNTLEQSTKIKNGGDFQLEKITDFSEISLESYLSTLNLSAQHVTFDHNFIMDDLTKKIDSKLKEINFTEVELLEALRTLRLAEPMGQRGGSYVLGTVAGQNIRQLNLMLYSMGPSVSEQKNFIAVNYSLISNMEFKAGLTISTINAVNVTRLADRLVPLTTPVLPMQIYFNNEIKVRGDLSAPIINSAPSSAYLTLSENRTLLSDVVLQDSAHSSGDVSASFVNDVMLSYKSTLLAKKDEDTVIQSSVAFRDVIAGNVTSDQVIVSGVPLNDVITVNGNFVVTGVTNFTHLQVAANVTPVTRLLAVTVDSVNVKRLLGDSLRKSGMLGRPQTMRGNIKMETLKVTGNVNTNGFVNLNEATLEHKPVIDLSLLAEKVIYLGRGGKLKYLHITGDVDVNNLQLKGLLDGVSLPVRWLRSSGAQTFTAPLLLLTQLNAGSVTAETLAGPNTDIAKLLANTLKTDQNLFFKKSATFDTVTIAHPLTVHGLVQGLRLPHDVVLDTDSAVTFSAEKFFMDDVNVTSLIITGTVNGVDVNKLCVMNSVVNVTVQGDATFRRSVRAQSVKSGGRSVPVDGAGDIWWRTKDNVVIPGNVNFDILSAPAGSYVVKMNEMTPEEAFGSVIPTRCSHINVGHVWKLVNLTVKSANVKNVETHMLQGASTSTLSSVVSLSLPQTFTGVLQTQSASAADVSLNGSVHGIPVFSFCHRGALCRVTANTTLEGDLTVLGDVHTLAGSNVQGVSVSAAAAALVSRSRGGHVRGRTTVLGKLAVQGPFRVDGLVNGVNFTRKELLTKSDDRNISTLAIISATSGTAITAPFLTTDDGLVFNHSLAEIARNSFRRGSPSVVMDFTLFTGDVLFRSASSSYRPPHIAAPSQLARLKDDYERLDDMLRVNGDEDTEFLGWLEKQVIPGDWHRAVSVSMGSTSFLAVLPWRGSAFLLQKDKDGSYFESGLTLPGTCVNHVSGWQDSAGLKFVVSDACPLGRDELDPAGSADRELRQISIDNYTVSVMLIAGRSQIQTEVFFLNGWPCVASVNLASSVVPVHCERGGQYELWQNLIAPRPIQVAVGRLGGEVVLVVASLGYTSYGGNIDVWSPTAGRDQVLLRLLQHLPAPGVQSVCVSSSNAGLLVASLDRSFRDGRAAVTMYRMESLDASATLWQRLNVPDGRQLALHADLSARRQLLLVLTKDGSLLRFEAGWEGRFRLTGNLQQTDIISMTTWRQRSVTDASYNSADSAVVMAVVVKNSHTAKTKTDLIVYESMYSSTYKDFL